MLASDDLVILGSRGMLGTAMSRAVIERGLTARLHVTERFTNPGSIIEFLSRRSARYVVNCTGYTGTSSQDHYRTNACVPRTIADWCGRHGARLVQISTNAVFPSMPNKYWLPSDSIRPSTPYEVSKAFGEDPRAAVLRVSIIGRNARGTGRLEALLRGEPVTEMCWNGVTTLTLARWIASKIIADAFEQGICHIHAPAAVRMSEIADWLGSTSPILVPEKCSALLAGGPDMPHLRDQITELLSDSVNG